MEHTNLPNLEDKVMAEITSGKVKLRSRYLFLSEKLGLGSAVALTILLAVLALAVVLFYLVSADSLAYLEFGNPGVWAFLESFPFPLVITLVLLIFLAGRLVALTGRGYAYSFGKLAIVLLVAIIILGSALALTGVAEKLANQKFIKPLIHLQMGQHGRGVAGKIIAVGEKAIIIRTPRSSVQVNTEQVSHRRQEQFELETFIIAIGQWQGKEFVATQVKIANPEDLRFLRPHMRIPMGEPLPVIITPILK